MMWLKIMVIVPCASHLILTSSIEKKEAFNSLLFPKCSQKTISFSLSKVYDFALSYIIAPHGYLYSFIPTRRQSSIYGMPFSFRNSYISSLPAPG